MKANIYDILFWVLFVISITVGLWYIFGHSPTFEQALLILIITFLFKIQANVTSNNTEIKVLKKSFFRLVEDFKKYIKHE